MDSEAIRPVTPALRNRFDRMEWAGAFGDLGTLIPFVVAYLSVLKMDPFGVLLAFGAAMLVYRGDLWLCSSLTLRRPAPCSS